MWKRKMLETRSRSRGEKKPRLIEEKRATRIWRS